MAKKEIKNEFDLDTETVIGFTNKNHQKIRQEEQKRISKKQAKIEKKKKRIKRVVAFITIILILFAGMVFAMVSPLFNITEIEVSNNNIISQETIVSLSGLTEGQNLFRFSKRKVRKAIKTNPYIEKVKIKRKLPNKVEIIVTERERNFAIEFLNGYFYINNQGYILEISEQKIEGIPIIVGIATEQEQVTEGSRLKVEDLEKLEIAIEIMNACKNYELDTKVSSIDLTDKTNYMIYMESEKKTICLGDSSNLNNKILYVVTILEENQDKEGTIYVDGDINGKFKPRFREKV